MPYSKKVIDAFKNPHNYGKLKDYSGLGKIGNPICGDVLYLYIKINKNEKGKEIIEDISFETFGCVAALAPSSIITDLAKGKTISEALKLSREDVTQELGGLPEIKIHCSVLAIDALHKAVDDYRSKKDGE